LEITFVRRGKIYLDSDLNDYNWYSVTSSDTVLAIFQIIDVRSSYSKNLSIYFSPEKFTRDGPNEEELDHIIKVIIFIFDSIVQICSENKMEKVKFHTHDKLMELIFSRLAKSHKLVKNARKYGKWVEVSI